MGKVLLGNWLLVICSICYLAWWLITFKPPAPKGSMVGTLILIGAFASGLSGLFFAVTGMASPSEEVIQEGIPGILIIASGIILYAILLLLTRTIFHRQVTSELFIIVGWSVLEAALCNYMYTLGEFSAKEAIICAAVILLVSIISLICYILYYELSYVKGYIDGCIPLVLCMIVMIILNLRIKD